MQKAIEHRHRLNLSNYKGLVRASFTLCIKEKKKVFIQNNIVNCFVKILNETRKKYACTNWAYVFMPDHIHIVLEGECTSANLWKTITLFKQKTGYWFLKNMPWVKWQKDFYDQIHKTESELIYHILYVANNPVRKNLVAKWQDYPYLGSLDSDLHAIIWDLPQDNNAG